MGFWPSRAAGALRLIGVAGDGVAGDGIHARRVIGGVDDAQVVVLAQEGLSVLRADLDVVDSLGVGEVRVDAGVGEGAVLRDGRGLQIGRAEVGEWIGAGVVVVVVAADECAQVEDRCRC